MLLRYKTKKHGEKPRLEDDHFSLSSRPSSSPVRPGEFNGIRRPPIAPDTPVSRTSSSQDLPFSTTESSWDLYGLTPVQTQRDDLEAAHQQQQADVADAKRKVSTLRKIFSRLGYWTGFKEEKIDSNGVVGNGNGHPRETLDQQLAVTSAYRVLAPEPEIHDSDGFPLPLALSPVAPNNELVLRRSLPPGVSTDYDPHIDYNTHMQLLPPIEATNDFANSIDNRLSTIQVSRRTMNDELEAAQQKLNQLFDSQALLRERYNSERHKSLSLDAEYQRTHTRIHSLEQSTRHMDDELKRLHEYVSTLERANRDLRQGMQAAEIEKHDPYEDSGLPSPKLTLAIPPVPQIQPLQMRPPPIPKKADRRSMRRPDDSASPVSPSKSTLKPINSNEDKSFW
jgi:hypothetical protein